MATKDQTSIFDGDPYELEPLRLARRETRLRDLAAKAPTLRRKLPLHRALRATQARYADLRCQGPPT